MVNKKTITLSGITVANKTYDGNTSATVSVAGAVFNDKVSGDNLSVASTGTFSDKNAATGKTVSLVNALGGDDLGNYSITEQASTTADIGKADLTVSGLSARNKVYDDNTNAQLSGTPAVTPLGSDVITLGGSATGAFADKNVGTGKAVAVTGVTLDSTSANNYNLIQQVGLTADIEAVPTPEPTPTPTPTPALTMVQETAKAVAQATAARAATGIVSIPQANVSLSIFAPSSPGNMAPSGGLSFVEVPSESVTSSENTGNTRTASSSTQGGSSNVSAGRDVSGFMRIFVVGGGINLEGR